ncbi:MAG: tRNA (guanosine(37)-N1)-methyltransferase TrmD [Clostridia bacterium]|nr:tRNA (guanosine(37)-N1)-methyltransferase TrmD [Clostridia bacterium]
MQFDIMTLFPDMVSTVLSASVLGRAQKADLFRVTCHNIRDYSADKHKKTDDTPYGGGMGMLMTPGPIDACFRTVIRDAPADEKRLVVYLSPKGKTFNQRMAASLCRYDRLVLLCGHYEGVDQRILDEIVDEEISVGDYVLTGGELPACIVVDAVVRMLDGVLAAPASFEEESFSEGLLEYPQYTKPAEFHGVKVPEILLSGNHEKIAAWRLEQSLLLTKERRPELYEAYLSAHPEEPRKKKRRKALSHAESGENGKENKCQNEKEEE